MTLSIRGLHAGYGALSVLHGVDIEVAPGELVALVGSNGAGKTTLLRAISGLVKPKQGSVHVGGKDVTGLAPEKIAAAGLAHVPENRLVFPTLSVDDNLRLGAWSVKKGTSVEALRATALELFPKLEKRIDQAAGTMSGGEQQMAAIARGLMADPVALVLDEPSLGLAPKVIQEIFGALARIRIEKNLAILLVEQNIHAAFKVADRVVVIDRGSVVLTGTPNELVEDPRVRSAYLGGGYHEE